MDRVAVIGCGGSGKTTLSRNMPASPNRVPRAPQLDVDPASVQVAKDVFVDEALHEGFCLEGSRLAEIQAKQVELKRFVLTEVDLGGAKLDGLDLEDAVIKGCNFANLRSHGCTLERIVLEGSRLTGAMLVEPRLKDVVLRDSPVDLASFRFGRLERVRFEHCRLIEADLQGVIATACTFIDCDLTGAQLSHANFAGSAFRGCLLAGVSGVDALKGAQVAREDIMELAIALATSLGIELRDDIT